MPLSIRGRLTLWYGLVLLVVLIGAGGAILVLYSQLGLANIDRQLQNRAATVAAEVLQELEEGETLDESVEEVEDIELPETGVAVVDEADVVLIFRDIGLLDTHESVVGARDGAVTVESSSFGVRFWPEPFAGGDRQFRVIVWTSLEDYRRERAALTQALLLGVPLALLIAVAGGWSISRRALRPLTDMSAQAGAITSLHPASRLRTPNPNDELGTLAAAFNALLDRLKRFSNRPCTTWGGRGTSARTDAGGLMRAYSMDLRERVLLDSDAGMKAADVAAKYRVSGSWVRLLKQRRRETGEVAPRVQRHGRRCMLEPHLHTLADLIAAQPDRTLAELKDALATPASVPTVWRAVRALGLTVKKNGPPVRTRSA